jgi:hypothetical protein
MLIYQLTPHLPKDKEEVNAQVKHLQAMLNAAVVVDPVTDHGGDVRNQDPNHRRSPHGDSANILTPLEECGRR